MSASRFAALLAVSGLLVAGGPAATAVTAPTIDKSKLLWATINVCDTVAHPDTVGIRASMPGSGRPKERMYMRFQVQFFDTATQRWRDIGPAADSGFLLVGSARYRRRESGRNFSMTPPPAGSTYRLRGVVTFEWRKGQEVMRRARKRTRAGHPGTIGSDPKGYSAAECVIRPD